MKILIDIGHPAHVHLFKEFAHEMKQKGHELLFTCRDKEFEIALLRHEGFEYISFGRKYKSVIGKLYGLLKFDIKEWKTCLKFKPDILLSHGSMYAAHAAWLINKPHISFEDTFNFEQIKLYKSFSDIVLTSDYDNPLTSDKKNISYAGYHGLAYLHPNLFTPDKSVLEELGIKESEKYVVIRFVSWDASHDIGHKGITFENKLKAVKEFGKYAKVFVSSEKELPEELKEYQIKIEPHRMHDVIAFASLLFGESTSMAEEAAMLGVPSICLNTPLFYIEELEKKYHLIYSYIETVEGQDSAISKGIELLKADKKKQRDEWLKKRDKMLETKINVTAFLVWFIENYPESKKIMKENPDYQYRFK